MQRNGEVKEHGLIAYLRMSERYLISANVEPRRAATIDIARVSVQTPGQGLFKQFLHGVECIAAARERTVYIENVVDERFREFFRKRGYTECEGGFGTRSFYLERK
jgi:hypothetical protein